MSQFIIFRPKASSLLPKRFQAYSLDGAIFLKTAAVEIFGPTDLQSFYSGKFGFKDFDELFTKTQQDLAVGKDYFCTDLFVIIEEMLIFSIDIAFWYANDFDNLDFVTTSEDLHNRLKESLLDDRAELYVKYSCKKI